MRVLLVDDSVAVRAYLRKQLGETGLEFTELLEAANGSEALNLLKQQFEVKAAPDLMIMDMNMPVMNGEDLMKHLRVDDRFKTIPVLVFTTDSTATRARRMAELGVAGYITKPCEAGILRLKIEQVLRSPSTSSMMACAHDPRGARRVVLVVEPDPVSRFHLEAALTRFGFQYLSVESGEDALQQAARNCPSLVVTEVELNGSMDGIRLAEQLMAEHNLPVLYLTGKSDDSTVDRAQTTNPYGFLIKPLDEAGLRCAIHASFYKEKARRRHRSSQATYKALLDSLPDAVVASSTERKVTFVNKAAERLTGWDIASAKGRDFMEVFQVASNSIPLQFGDLLQSATNASALLTGGSGMLRRKGNGEVSINFHVAPVWGSGRQCDGLLVNFHQSTEAHADNKHEPAGESPLENPDAVEIPTREDGMAAMFRRIVAKSGNEYAAVFVMDRFQFYSKRLGQAVIADARKAYGLHITAALSANDELFEWGEECFVALLQRAWSFEEVRQEVAMIASRKLQRTVFPAGRQAMIVLTSSWQVVRLNDTDQPAEIAIDIDRFVRQKTAGT